MSWLLPAIILAPMVAAVATFLTRRWRRLSLAFSLGGAAVGIVLAVQLVAAVFDGAVVVIQMGSWPAPFGITLVADRLSAVMVLLAALTGAATIVTSVAELGRAGDLRGSHPMLHFLLMGVVGAFLTGDLFNLYVWFEVMLLSSFGLLAFGGRREQLDGAVKYVALNLVATVLFLLGVGLLYGLTGTLNMADLHQQVPRVERQGLLMAVAMLLLVSFGLKGAVFPLFFWLPASYHTPSVSVSALFSGLLTKVGVYALIRTFTLVFTGEDELIRHLLLVAAGATMVVGVLGAAAQAEVRRILSFHIISQIGYMVLGLALMTPLALAGAVFYLVHHIIVKANLFLIAGLLRRLGGSMELARLGGLSRKAPSLALLFLIPALSLAGIPPLSGFWAKLVVIKATLEAESFLLAAVALAVGLVTVFSMAKIWLSAFWSTPPEEARSPAPLVGAERLLLFGPVAALAGLTLVIGLWAEPLVAYSEAAAAALLDPRDYVTAVLGGGER